MYSQIVGDVAWAQNLANTNVKKGRKMSLVFFEGFEHYSSYNDVSGILNIPYNMYDDSRTIKPIFAQSDNEVYAKSSGTMLVTESSHQAGTTTNGQYLAFYPSVSFDLQSNLNHGTIGFSYYPLLPTGGTFGDGDLTFTPIGCITDDAHKPHFFLCMTNNGQLQIRKYTGDLTYKVIDTAGVTNNVQTYPKFLQSQSNSSLLIGGTGTKLPLMGETSEVKNRVYEGYWNYIEFEFNFSEEYFITKINRDKNSQNNELSISKPTDLLLDTVPASMSGTPTVVSPYVKNNISNSSVEFQAKTRGTVYYTVFFRGSDGGDFDEYRAEWRRLPSESVIISHTAFSDFSGSFNVIENESFQFRNSDGTSDISLYFVPENTLTLQENKYARYLVLGTFWGHAEGNISPAADLHWKTFIDDIYCINNSGGIAPSGFLGTVACRRVPYDEVVSNTVASGNLLSVSEPFAGSGSFKLPEGNGSIFFDSTNQEFFVKLNEFNSENEEIIAIQTLFNGYSLNSDNYIGLSLEIANGSGSLDFEEITLSTDAKSGGIQSRLYTTDPSGNPWTEDSVRNTTFKLKSLSNN